MKQPVEIETIEDVIICRLSGELSSPILNRLKQEVASKTKNEKIYKLIINMAEVEFVTSKDLGVFVQIYRFLDNEAKRSSAESGCQVCLTNLGTYVNDVIRLTKLETVFRIHKTEEEALAALRERK